MSPVLLSGPTKNQFQAHYQPGNLILLFTRICRLTDSPGCPQNFKRTHTRKRFFGGERGAQIGKARGFKIAQGGPSKMTAVRLSQGADKSK